MGGAGSAPAAPRGAARRGWMHQRARGSGRSGCGWRGVAAGEGSALGRAHTMAPPSPSLAPGSAGLWLCGCSGTRLRSSGARAGASLPVVGELMGPGAARCGRVSPCPQPSPGRSGTLGPGHPQPPPGTLPALPALGRRCRRCLAPRLRGGGHRAGGPRRGNWPPGPGGGGFASRDRGLAPGGCRPPRLTPPSRRRYGRLERILPAAQGFQEAVDSFQEWLGATERQLAQLWHANGCVGRVQDAHRQTQVGAGLERGARRRRRRRASGARWGCGRAGAGDGEGVTPVGAAGPGGAASAAAAATRAPRPGALRGDPRPAGRAGRRPGERPARPGDGDRRVGAAPRGGGGNEPRGGPRVLGGLGARCSPPAHWWGARHHVGGVRGVTLVGCGITLMGCGVALMGRTASRWWGAWRRDGGARGVVMVGRAASH